MGLFSDRFSAGAHRLRWLEYTQYAGRLLAGGRAPWRDTAACIAWYRKAQGLLRSDVVTLPVDAVCDAWLEAHPLLREAMAAKARPLAPLRTLLADEGLRRHMADLAGGVRAGLPGAVLALACPSPRRWVGDAFRAAHRTEAEVGEDEADGASLYIADFLRSFAGAGLDVLLLAESAATEPGDAAGIECYRSVLNVAGQYRWDAGLLVPAGRYRGGEAGLQFVIAPGPLPGASWGALQPAAFWDGAGMLPGPAFHYAEIPDWIEPERVLDRLARLN
ncbi:hypothetical protein V4F39_14320 [Aquincola sp. MAHUQ-54]|uniref:DUF3025 family protein n=1 Tax=Aquincola agrisoli TaxID=3119538 RepID=A0AAW9QI75_9BURK